MPRESSESIKVGLFETMEARRYRELLTVLAF